MKMKISIFFDSKTNEHRAYEKDFDRPFLIIKYFDRISPENNLI